MNYKSKIRWKIVINIHKLSSAHADKESVNKTSTKEFMFTNTSNSKGYDRDTYTH